MLAKSAAVKVNYISNFYAFLANFCRPKLKVYQHTDFPVLNRDLQSKLCLFKNLKIQEFSHNVVTSPSSSLHPR